MKVIKSFIFATLMLGLTATAFAQRAQMQRGPADRPGPAMSQQRFQMMQGAMNRAGMRTLDLTEEQQEQIGTLRLENRRQMITLQNRLGELQARLRTLTTGADPDQGAAEDVIDDIATLRADIAKNQLALRLSIRELLTDEQRLIFDTAPRQAPLARRLLRGR